jgi:hypothetical protein
VADAWHALALLLQALHKRSSAQAVLTCLLEAAEWTAVTARPHSMSVRYLSRDSSASPCFFRPSTNAAAPTPSSHVFLKQLHGRRH